MLMENSEHLKKKTLVITCVEVQSTLARIKKHKILAVPKD